LGHTQSEPIKINFNGISAFESPIAGRNQVKGWRENGQLPGPPVVASIRECVSRELTQKEILLPTALNSLLPSRNFLLQLFKPVQDDVDLRCCCRLIIFLDHHKPLAVWRDIVVRHC